jgi:hypothetical protein
VSREGRRTAEGRAYADAVDAFTSYCDTAIRLGVPLNHTLVDAAVEKMHATRYPYGCAGCMACERRVVDLMKKLGEALGGARE